jgi:hypothetical protein
MSLVGAFSGFSGGQTITLTADLAARSIQLTPANFGMPGTTFCGQYRMVNRGSADIFISLTPATAVIALPVAGTTTVGTPALGIYLIPGIVEVFTATSGPSLWINSISTAAAQVFYISCGEGI